MHSNAECDLVSLAAAMHQFAPRHNKIQDPSEYVNSATWVPVIAQRPDHDNMSTTVNPACRYIA